MHGFNSGFTCLVNAEVDSMGGAVDGGVGIGTKSSPCRAAIEKAQTALRLEYDVLEERRRELEFLEKGGNPLDFKLGHAASVSVQSTSKTIQHPDQFLTSEAKGSFALATSPYGDSVESSGRLGVSTACEPNSADNFDGDNELLEGERKTRHGISNITPSEHSSQLDGSQNVKESEDSPIFHPKKSQAYRRRKRSRSSCDGPRSISIDMTSHAGHGPSFPSIHVVLSKPVASENQSEMESDGLHALRLSTTSIANEFPEGKQNTSASKDKHEESQDQSVNAEEAPIATSSCGPILATGHENIVYVNDEYCPCSDAEKNKNNGITVDLKESSKMNRDGKCTPTEGPLSTTGRTTRGLDVKSSCTQTSLSVGGHGNIDGESCLNLRNLDNDMAPKEHKVSLGEKEISKDVEMMNVKDVSSAMGINSCNYEDLNDITHKGNIIAEKKQVEFDRGRSPAEDEANCPSDVGCQEAYNHSERKSEGQEVPLEDSIPKVNSSSSEVLRSSVDPSCRKPNKIETSASPSVSQPQICAEDQPKVVDKAQEERTLEEARIIEAKHKRIAELSGGLLLRECRQKSHWDFVVEEMAWLANDFAQERLWKVTVAVQLCRQVAFASQLRLEEKNKCSKQKSIAHSLAKAVMEFWNSAGLLVRNVNSSPSEKCGHDTKTDDIEVAERMDDGSERELESLESKRDLAVHKYAVRFLQLNFSSMPSVEAEVSRSPYIASDADLVEISWQSQLTEENLFYEVPPGAMYTYGKSISLCLEEFKRTANNVLEEVDTSMYDAPSESGYQDNDYEEDEGENIYYLPGAFGTGKASKKNQKNMKSYSAKSYDVEGDLGYGQHVESRNGAQQSSLIGKRSSYSLHVGSIPTKKIRTASRQRVVGFFNAGSTAVTRASYRPETSSGDTNSFQDDQSTLHGGCIVPRGSEADSAVNFEKQSPFESTQMLAKPKKKMKKIKHQGAGYDRRWLLDSAMQNEQKDHARKRVDAYQLECSGNSLYGQHAKKLKVMKLPLDNSADNTMPMTGSVASPVASQMSNMSNQSKIIKLIGGRDRGRKAKVLKVSSGQAGSGSAWTLFEDQALVVLVHDMGPNWELVSDAMNSTLRFKCIFRKPKECKERHKNLMDRTSGDGADSAEDSGSSQPYPSTLPGIPKGSARQLFQRLQGPMEEDTIKSHFERIILIGQHFHYWKKQNNTQDLKQIVPVHGSHAVSLSQVILNNVNGGTLTPLDLCDAAESDQDLLSLGYQGPHAVGLQVGSQSTGPPMHSSGGIHSSLQAPQGSSSMGVGNNLASSSSQLNSPRDARYPVPRSASLPIEEQQRLQQYNQMLHGRNVQPSNLNSAAPSGTDRAVRALPSGNSVGSGMNRSMPISRPGFRGLASSSMLSSGSMLASSMGGMPSNMNMPSGAALSQGNSTFRHRDPLHMVRPGHSSEHKRQMMMPEMQMQGEQSNSQGVPPFGGVSSGFTNQTASPPVQTYHQQQQQHSHVRSGAHHPRPLGSNHSATPEQQAFLRQRQIQQKLVRQQQLLSSSQLASSSSLQSSSQLQSQSATQHVAFSPLSSSSPVTHASSQPPQVLGGSRQSGASGTLTAKQRQRLAHQQYQQSGRQHPQQRQQAHPQQLAKHLKGVGKSNMFTHQNLPMGPSHLNGLSAKPGAQVPEKGEQAAHLMQGQGLYSVPGLNTMHSSINHQDLQGQSQPPLKAVNQSHRGHERPIQQSHLVNSDPLAKLQADHPPSEHECPSNTSSVKALPSSANTAVRVTQECLHDSAIPNSPSSSGPGITNSSGNEPLPSVGPGLGQKQLSAKLVPQGNIVGVQWQQQQPHPLQPLLPHKQSQHQLQQLEQSPQRVPQ